MAEGYAEVAESVKERPILFSAPMVRAILEGRKTQTRRIVSPKNSTVLGYNVTAKSKLWTDLDWTHAWKDDGFHKMNQTIGEYLHVRVKHDEGADGPIEEGNYRQYRVRSRFEFGDRLWVREKFAPSKKAPKCQVAYEADGKCVGCGGDGAGGYLQVFHGWLFPDVTDKGPSLGRGLYESWKPSIHMPRWASRITLEITDVRVQRLAEISEADAMAEGISECLIPATGDHPNMIGYMVGPDDGTSILHKTPVDSFRKLWHTIHAADGPHGWEANPWLWCITFRRVG